MRCPGPAIIRTSAGTGAPATRCNVADDELNLGDELVNVAGAGLFSRIDASIVLTAPRAESPTRWQLPFAFHPHPAKVPLSYHGRLDRWGRTAPAHYSLHSVSRGQELVLDMTHYPQVAEWLAGLLEM